MTQPWWQTWPERIVYGDAALCYPCIAALGLERPEVRRHHFTRHKCDRCGWEAPRKSGLQELTGARVALPYPQQPFRRYMLLAWCEEPIGGVADCVADFDELEDALDCEARMGKQFTRCIFDRIEGVERLRWG